jgi:murein DD-endopeptidase MepM/ murein hydrolase activator NlpD
MQRYFNFLYVRGDNAGVRTIRVHRVVLFAALVGLVAIVSAAAIVLVADSRRVANRFLVEQLSSENQKLREELSKVQGEIAGLERKMELSFELQNRACIIASVEPISKDVWRVGVGGPGPALGELEKVYPDTLFSRIDESLDQMVRQSQLQLQSYDEILGVLGKEKAVRQSTPSVRPLRGGFVSSRFGRRMDPFNGEIVLHPGVDYRARTGTSIMSTADGVVTAARRNGGYGLMIEISHGNGFKTRYAHLSKALVRRGQKVKRGEIIGLVGNTGHSTGSHLHYEVLFRGEHRDPLQYVIPDGFCYD